jgi:hypothetical protein
MTSRTTRVVRGLSAAAVALFVAAFSHVAAGGAAPGQAGAALAAAFSAIVCVALAGRSLSVTRLSIAVLISQFVFHLLFGVGAGSGSGLTLTTSHHHGQPVSSLVPDAAGGAVSAAAVHSHGGGWMWLGHAVAAVLTIALLARGEVALRRLLTIGRTRLAEPLAAFAERSTVLVRALALLSFTEASRAGHRANARLRNRRAVFGLAVAPVLRERILTLGSLGHRGPPRAAPVIRFS